MNILVCGGAGYIGAPMCRRLAGSGHDVTVFDNLSTGHAEAVRWGTLIRGDLVVREDIERVFQQKRFDAVMHFCAKALVGESTTRPDSYYHNNVTGTINLLNAMVAHEVKVFIFSSSAAVYGLPQYTPIDERHPTAPINPYGQTKRMVENMLADYEAAFGLRSVSLRYFNAAGAEPEAGLGERHEPETHLIPNVLCSALNASAHSLKVFGADYATPDGTCIRDYIHVTDLCDAHLQSLDYLMRGNRGDVFNLGNGKGFSVLQVIDAARTVTGRHIPYSMVDRRPGDPAVLVASAEKARKVLNWTPRYTELAKIIETAWQWHQSQQLS